MTPHHRVLNARVLIGLLVPADPCRPLELRGVADTAAAFSDLLGGVLLDDAITWNLGGGGSVSLYWAENRAVLPVNQRLSVLATRLGIVDRTFHANACGEALLLGATRQGRDLDLPGAVVVAVERCGYRLASLAPPTGARAGISHAGGQSSVPPGGQG